MERIQMLCVVSLVIIIITVMFTALLVAAGTIQLHMAASGIDLVGYAGNPPEGIIRYMIISKLLTSTLGPPLSGAATLLNAINPNWWLNNYFAWIIVRIF